MEMAERSGGFGTELHHLHGIQGRVMSRTAVSDGSWTLIHFTRDIYIMTTPTVIMHLLSSSSSSKSE